MSKGNKNSDHRERLWKRDPRCRRCGVLTWSPRRRTQACVLENVDFHATLPWAELQTMATLEHTVARFESARLVIQPHVERRVLFCYACNQASNREKLAALGLNAKGEKDRVGDVAVNVAPKQENS